MGKRRVVITGVGMVSPVGLTVKESWENILAGKSGIAPITHFDASEFSTRFGGSVKGFEVTDYMSAKDARKMDAFIHYGIAAAKEAIEDSGLEVSEENAERIGVAVGSGIGGLPGIEKGHDAYLKSGTRK
ncbi:MAG: beta-ketoacyl-ACP synthase II, partial [Gammaproteobacteria bacterium]|nr:beta-ketoacyl-ACP synthase II [Gammaproteobacteria bacterium]